MDRFAVEHLRRLAHEDHVAVPSHAKRAHPEFDGHPVAMLVELVMWQDASLGAEPTVSLLQGDDIRIDLAQHLHHALGIAATVEPDALVDVVAGDLDHEWGV